MRLNEAFHATVVILFLYLSKMQQSPGQTRSGPPHVTASCGSMDARILVGKSEYCTAHSINTAAWSDSEI